MRQLIRLRLHGLKGCQFLGLDRHLPVPLLMALAHESLDGVSWAFLLLSREEDSDDRRPHGTHLGRPAVTDFDADGGHQPTRIRVIEPKDDLILRVMVRDSMRFCHALGAGSGLSVDERNAFSLLYSAPRTAYFVAERRDTVLGGAGFGPLPCDFTHIAELQRFILLPMSGHLEI